MKKFVSIILLTVSMAGVYGQDAVSLEDCRRLAIEIGRAHV